METARKRPSGPEPWKRQAPEPGEEDAADEEGRGRAREERPETSRRAGRPGGALVTMAGLDPEPAVPVWLTEDDLGCIICHGLLASPATLPCGHSFCLDCLKGLWVCAGAGRHRSCPTCRQGVAPRLQLRKNTLLQDLADKYSRAARQREAGPGPNSGSDSDSAPGAQAAPRAPRCAAPLPVVVRKSLTEAGRDLAELVEQLLDIVKGLQSESHLPEPGPDNEAFSGGVDLSLASPKLEASNTPERRMRNILHNLEEIQEKLWENFTWKEALEQREESPPSSACPLPDQSRPAPKKVSCFDQWAISPTFDLQSLSCSLEVSKDCQTVTVCHYPQAYPWSRERFVTCQVLCSQAFSSGQQYWEVDTQNCSHWAVGVASWGINRHQILGRTRDSWCVEWKGTSQLSAWHMIKETVLGSEKPRVVGIWLDLKEGKLAFYSVANDQKLLFECPVSASSPLRPAFWLYGLQPGNSLTIRPVKV